MFRILTLNLNHYGTEFGEWEQRKPRIVETILQADADILAFQAVRMEQTRFGGLNQAAQLSVELPEYQYALYQPAVIYEDGSAEGCAVLSRTPIKDAGYKPLTFLSGYDDPNRRVALYACFEVDHLNLNLFNAHTSWVEEQAELNIKEVLEFASAYQGFRVLVGDLNNAPDSKIMQSVAYQGWVDGWKKLHPDEPGYTFNSREPKLRIDYVWVDQNYADTLTDVQVLGGNSPENGFLSDHAALLATFNP